MKKDPYCVFTLKDYSEEQLNIITILHETYPRVKWFQLLSPYHCMLIYYGLNIQDREDDIFEAYNWLISKYGNITVQLDFALNKYVQKFAGRKTYEDSYASIKKMTGKDGDSLGTIIMRELEISHLPTREYVRHNNEIDVEPFILRVPIDEEGLAWCLEFTGFNEDNCNIVNMWNVHRKRYIQYVTDMLECEEY